MTISVNKVLLQGNLGKDAETKFTEGGMQITNMAIATNEGYFDKEDKWVDKSEWHNLVGFAKTAELMAKCEKGDSVFIEGKLATQSWAQDGVKKYKTEIIVNSVKREKKRPSDGSTQVTNTPAPVSPPVVDDDSPDLPF